MSSAPLDPTIGAYYEQGKEQDRLATLCRLEFVRTQELLGRYLPQAPARVLDIGGGPGRYATWLQAAGYEVILTDPVALHVDQARAAGIDARRGDARVLEFPDDYADAVLLLGPLYHLQARSERVAALAEAKRVLRSGGVVAAAGISRYASTYDGLLRGFLEDAGFEAIVKQDLATGCHGNPGLRPGWFTASYFHLPGELGQEIEAAGLGLETIVAVEGPGGVVADIDNWLDDERRREILLRAIARVEAEPSILGSSSHFLAVAHNEP